ncbi:MAG: methyltransferase domain-containing protein, partial [Pseudomonadota bacterium]
EGLAQFEDGFFDGVIMRSYLEHEAHPRKVLEATYRALRPGGVIYVKVPNFATINRVVRGREWCGFRFPDHLNYFTINSLRTMADGVGFDFELKNTMSRYTNDNLHCFLTRPT